MLWLCRKQTLGENRLHAGYRLQLINQLLFLNVMAVEMNEMLTAIPWQLTCWSQNKCPPIPFSFHIISRNYQTSFHLFSWASQSLFYMRHWLYSQVICWLHLQQSGVPSARQTISTAQHTSVVEIKKGGSRAVRYDNIYRVTVEKRLSFHIISSCRKSQYSR